MNSNETQGTWEEVFQCNEQELRDLELRIVRSRYRELRIWRDDKLFTVAKGTAANTGRWELYACGEYYYGDSVQEVLEQAMLHGYPEIVEWSSEWNDR